MERHISTAVAREEQLTTEYRQKASLLAASAASSFHQNSNTNSGSDSDNLNTSYLSLTVAKHMLVRHPGYVPIRLLQQSAEKGDSTAALSSSVSVATPTFRKISATTAVHVPCCTHCANPLQPGWGGTTVRLRSAAKLSRTQRRRASRQVAKGHVQSKKHRSSRAAPAASSTLAASQQQQQPISKLVAFCRQQQQHGGNKIPLHCRNYLRIKCGTCQTTVKVPGLRRQAATTKATIRNHPSSLQRSHVPSKSTKQTQTKFLPNKDQTATANANVVGDDFLALEPSADKKRSPPPAAAVAAVNRSRQQQKQLPTTLLNQGERKKKKPKSEQLRNFLSSLNNP